MQERKHQDGDRESRGILVFLPLSLVRVLTPKNSYYIFETERVCVYILSCLIVVDLSE
jgi:hypothetical protein